MVGKKNWLTSKILGHVLICPIELCQIYYGHWKQIEWKKIIRLRKRPGTVMIKKLIVPRKNTLLFPLYKNMGFKSIQSTVNPKLVDFCGKFSGLKQCGGAQIFRE
jgi:hypothetical protein